MSKELAPRVNPKDYESAVYQFWLDKRLFHGDENSKKPAFSIVIPPPNITGSLHMGHALNNTIQDILIRFYKLKGYETMWLPGTDHAGIATQNVVEKRLAAQGKSRLKMGRDAFIEEVWKWKKESGGAIINQLKALGSACDWERERFTMDEGLAGAVRKEFVTLYNEGLIYRANYMVNWCVHCRTALSDLEVEFEDKQDFLYNMRYPLSDGSGALEIATTRPETYLGDAAVAVHPEDKRYAHLIGKTVTLPVINREIPVIADKYVEREFGTGCLKVTPAHDPNDFEIGKRHNLQEISCVDESGLITVGEFKGLDRFTARMRIINCFKELGLMGAEEPLTHSVGHCYRCRNVVEPMISLQWFVRVKPLADAAIKAVKDGRTKIVPKMWENSYLEWMFNIRDWCISRQIWWGHRIPAWHCKSCGNTTVSDTDIFVCPDCKSANIEQETDVLDTWFSSALWPFSTMGWPEKTPLLEKFYPTNALVTAFDILFFWVARMMMMGLKFMGETPFRHAYIHALIRDQHGQKMSKTKGNVIDPLIMIDKYGADAFRFTLTALAAQGRDIRLSEERIEGSRNFVNKIWNASRFLLMNMEETVPQINESELKDEDKWILTKLSAMLINLEKAIEGYEFNTVASELYHFFWMLFCDWYVELIKDRIFKDDGKDAAIATAGYVLEQSLVAMHPTMPFVTEHIWQRLTGKESIMKTSFPEAKWEFSTETKVIDSTIDLISLIRNIRGEYNVNPGQILPVYLTTDDDDIIKMTGEKLSIIRRMAKVSDIIVTDAAPDDAASQASALYAVYIPLSGLVNAEAELAKLKKELAVLEKDYNIYSGKLNNERYLAKAAPEIIAKDRAKASGIEKQMEKVREAIGNLGKY
ncbi:MAG: valine--tRNA ligase [Deferribacteraceae bacterium]|jgi:valyl-tRNA synthetase|nr:valine--tRNA ligase [Deferribacteraceae bacterium]